MTTTNPNVAFIEVNDDCDFQTVYMVTVNGRVSGRAVKHNTRHDRFWKGVVADQDFTYSPELSADDVRDRISRFSRVVFEAAHLRAA